MTSRVLYKASGWFLYLGTFLLVVFGPLVMFFDEAVPAVLSAGILIGLSATCGYLSNLDWVTTKGDQMFKKLKSGFWLHHDLTGVLVFMAGMSLIALAARHPGMSYGGINSAHLGLLATGTGLFLIWGLPWIEKRRG